MNYTNLADSPHLAPKTQSLIEKSFGYNDKNSFSIDFYPLFNKDNFKNCYVIEENGEVLAHIGFKVRALGEFPIVMFGGIAVAEAARRKGLFKKLFTKVIENSPNAALYLLWSDKLDLYNKFGFYPAGKLYEYPQTNSQTEFEVEEISWDQFKYEHLYSNDSELRLKRTTEDWIEVKKITSAKIFLIKDKSSVINYFIEGKGADLSGIIHEYGRIDAEQLNCMKNFGRVWSPIEFKNAIPLFGTVISPGAPLLFKNFILSIFKLEVKSFDSNSVTFEFESKDLTLPIADFLTGTFGPGQFSELSSIKPLFISGLDSI